MQEGTTTFYRAPGTAAQRDTGGPAHDAGVSFGNLLRDLALVDSEYLSEFARAKAATLSRGQQHVERFTDALLVGRLVEDGEPLQRGGSFGVLLRVADHSGGRVNMVVCSADVVWPGMEAFAAFAARAAARYRAGTAVAAERFSVVVRPAARRFVTLVDQGQNGATVHCLGSAATQLAFAPLLQVGPRPQHAAIPRPYVPPTPAPVAPL